MKKFRYQFHSIRSRYIHTTSDTETCFATIPISPTMSNKKPSYTYNISHSIQCFIFSYKHLTHLTFTDHTSIWYWCTSAATIYPLVTFLLAIYFTAWQEMFERKLVRQFWSQWLRIGQIPPILVFTNKMKRGTAGKKTGRREAPSLKKKCDFEGKNKEIHKENLLCWRELLPSLPGNKYFFQAWAT